MEELAKVILFILVTKVGSVHARGFFAVYVENCVLGFGGILKHRLSSDNCVLGMCKRYCTCAIGHYACIVHGCHLMVGDQCFKIP